MSHTLTTKTEYKSPPDFGRAALAMGGTIIGEGKHKLFSSKEVGYAVTLPQWNYPIVLLSDMSLRYDDYNGAWGDTADLDRLEGHYKIEVARSAATDQGWSSDVNAQGELIIFHPDGGTLTVSKTGKIDASNFIGSACVEPSTLIANALGRVVSSVKKPEMMMERARVTELP